MTVTLDATDFYKTGHPPMYPKGTTMACSNLTPRGSRMTEVDHVVVFGLQYFIKKYLIEEYNNNFFLKPKDEVVSKYQRRMDNALGKGMVKTEHIEALHDLGYLPLEIRVLPEGSLCPLRVPILTIKNTHQDFYWLPNYLETLLCCTTWQPITSATIALEYKKLLSRYAEETSDNPEFVQFQAHDFSMRGMSSLESAMTSGAAHLTSFVGTDTIPAIDFLEEYYEADSDRELVGCSVPASEHAVSSLTTALYEDQEEGEYEYFRHLMEDVYPTGILSLVSDTYDYWRVLTEFMPRLKETILSRDGKIVLRPDSGVPEDIICGVEYEKFDSFENALVHYSTELEKTGEWMDDPWYYYNDDHEYDIQVGDRFYQINVKMERWDDWQIVGDKTSIERTPEQKGTIELLWEIFGGTINSKGYKQLNDKIGCIYGDSITLQRCEKICRRLKKKGFSSTNQVFGVGSFTYQYNTRDTFSLAQKLTAAVVNSKPYEPFKSPKTDDGTKKSARGLLAVVPTSDGKDYKLIEQASGELEKSEWNCLTLVFRDGKLLKEYTLKEIRERLSSSL